jgi:hypothetical protein
MGEYFPFAEKCVGIAHFNCLGIEALSKGSRVILVNRMRGHLISDP